MNAEMVAPGWMHTQISAEQYDSWPEEQCAGIEVVDGMVVVSPSASKRHSRLARILANALDAAAGPEWNADTDFDVRLQDVPLTNRRPDVVVYRAETLDITPTRPEHVLLVVEVVSPGSETTDRIVKVDQYAKAGIPFYWRVEQAVTGFPSSTRTFSTLPAGSTATTRRSPAWSRPPHPSPSRWTREPSDGTGGRSSSSRASSRAGAMRGPPGARARCPCSRPPRASAAASGRPPRRHRPGGGAVPCGVRAGGVPALRPGLLGLGKSTFPICLFMDFISSHTAAPSAAKTRKPRTPGVTLFSSRSFGEGDEVDHGRVHRSRRASCRSIVPDAREEVVLG